MKKLISIILVAFMLIMFIPVISDATSVQPVYDATYNNNNGIFYANGNEIKIVETNGNTVVIWDGGSQIVPQTVTIIGGGTAGTNYDNTNITMEGGTVSIIYGGGMSLDSNSIANVGTSNVIVNGGTILQTVFGGGLMYSTTNTSNVTINKGTIGAVVGGGCASAVISGVAYSAGTATDMENSKNRVNVANVVINDGIIDLTPSNYGLVFGGGQGYSYVGITNLKINGGDMSKAYITAGGSNGYTGTANMEIFGGNINILQTVNRGKIENANVKMLGGIINTAYVGGENDASVTGTVNKIDFSILGGNVTNLNSGLNNSLPLDIEQNNYKLVYVDNTVITSNVGEKEITIAYVFEIEDEYINIYKNSTKQLNTKITTFPSGYEYLFESKYINWSSDDESIVTTNENGIVSAVSEGKTQITGTFAEQSDFVQVEVRKISDVIFFIVVIAIIFIAMAIVFRIY